MAKRIVVNGLGEVLVFVDNWKKEKIDAVVSAVQVAQNIVVGKARRLVPVKTGNLQDSIQAGRVVIRRDSAEGEVIAAMEYASYVEFGSFNVRFKKRNKPYPYMRPAIRSTRKTFFRLLRNALKT